MKHEYFEWNGVKSTSYGIYVSEQPPIMIPVERVEYKDVAGKSGSVAITEGERVYKDLTMPVKCWAKSDADLSIITSDNPRDEEPLSIIRSIVEGIEPTGGEYVVIENRREAIRYALTIAQPGDVVVLAGKGHETYQEIKGVKHPFDEKVVVQELLEEM